MGLFSKKDAKDGDEPLRSPRDIQLDSSIGEGYAVIKDDQQAAYLAKGYTLVEDLTGPMCLVRKGE